MCLKEGIDTKILLQNCIWKDTGGKGYEALETICALGDRLCADNANVSDGGTGEYGEPEDGYRLSEECEGRRVAGLVF